MTGIFAVLALAAITRQSPPPDQAYFDRLSHWRGQFEQVLKGVPPGPIGYGYLNSETLGGAHGEALYPIGSASERFLIFFEERDAGGNLLFQKRRGNAAVQLWDVPIVPLKGHPSTRGTVRKYLASRGLMLSPKKRLTADMRRLISQDAAFARYMWHPFSGPFNAVLRPDGTLTKIETDGDRCSITEAEKKLLRKRTAARQTSPDRTSRPA